MSTLDQVMDSFRQDETLSMEDRCREIIDMADESDADESTIECMRQCYSSYCTNIVSMNSIYDLDLYCEDCHFTCINCKEVCTPPNAASDLFEGSCINCTRCEDCGVPQWDYVCACSF